MGACGPIANNRCGLAQPLGRHHQGGGIAEDPRAVRGNMPGASRASPRPHADYSGSPSRYSTGLQQLQPTGAEDETGTSTGY